MTLLRTAIYVRAATYDSGEENPLVRQEQQLREYAEHHNYDVVQVYSDVGSGLKEDRPGLQQLMADAQAGRFSVLLMRDPSRLFRHSKLFEQYYDRLRREYGVDVVFVNLQGGAL